MNPAYNLRNVGFHTLNIEPRELFVRYLAELPRHSVGGLVYKLGFVFHVQSQIVEALKDMRQI